jgi:hypothetical protein
MLWQSRRKCRSIADKIIKAEDQQRMRSGHLPIAALFPPPARKPYANALGIACFRGIITSNMLGAV